MIACTPYQVASHLLAHMQAHLTETRAGEVDRVFVSPHADPVIEFCAAGTAYVGVRSARPIQSKLGKCAAVWQVELQAGVFRCFPVQRDNGPLPAVLLDSAARDVCDDMEAVRRAADEALAGMTVTSQTWLTVPPQGGAHGSKMSMLVEFSPSQYTEPLSPMLPYDPRAKD